MPPKKNIPSKKYIPPKKYIPDLNNDDDEVVTAIDVYEAQDEENVENAIKASLASSAPSASNSIIGNASLKKSINPLENRMPKINRTRRRIAEAGIASLDYYPALYDSLEYEEHAMLNNNNRGAQDSNSEWECSTCTYRNAKNSKNCGMCETARNNADLHIIDELRMSKKDIEAQLQELERYNPDLKKASETRLKLPLKSSQVDSKTAYEFGLTPRGAAAQITALQQIQEQHGPKFVYIDDKDQAYLALVAKCLADPFMIMGYQNGHNNLHYESTWKKEEGKENTFIGMIYIPKEDDLNDRKYTRYPNPLMSNTDGKTIVNLSLHNWAFGLHSWHDNNNKKNSENQIDINIKMPRKRGVSEVESTVSNPDFFSISETQKSIPYIVHDSAYSPDTGVLALDDAHHICLCNIEIENGPILRLSFYRNIDNYEHNSQIGGTRKRRRQTKRRQSKRRQTKRRR